MAKARRKSAESVEGTLEIFLDGKLINTASYLTKINGEESYKLISLSNSTSRYIDLAEQSFDSLDELSDALKNSTERIYHQFGFGHFKLGSKPPFVSLQYPEVCVMENRGVKTARERYGATKSVSIDSYIPE